jgi:hypothetical protein
MVLRWIAASMSEARSSSAALTASAPARPFGSHSIRQSLPMSHRPRRCHLITRWAATQVPRTRDILQPVRPASHGKTEATD